MSGFAESAVSPILLVLEVGLIAGNLLGGRLVDRHLGPALLGTVLVLAVVLGLLGFALHTRLAAAVALALFGVAAFATVSPLQVWVLQKAGGAQNLASSLSIGAFNLGNALGAWLGGLVIEHGAGLAAVPWAAALVTLAGLRVARPTPVLLAACER